MTLKLIEILIVLMILWWVGGKLFDFYAEILDLIEKIEEENEIS